MFIRQSHLCKTEEVLKNLGVALHASMPSLVNGSFQLGLGFEYLGREGGRIVVVSIVGCHLLHMDRVGCLFSIDKYMKLF